MLLVFTGQTGKANVEVAHLITCEELLLRLVDFVVTDVAVEDVCIGAEGAAWLSTHFRVAKVPLLDRVVLLATEMGLDSES